MKQILFFVFLLSFYASQVAAQGIVFFEGSWQQALDAAKAQNKPVFVDIYTVWCGPCKKMVKEVFPLKEVGDKFNADFINYKIDAEKGEGIEIAKKYKVNAYPTYLFVRGDGTLVYRSTGAMPSEKFLSEATLALREFSDSKPLAAWENEYDLMKTDREFVLEYLKKRGKLRLNSAGILDQYASICTREELLQSEIMTLLSQFMQMNTDGPFFAFLSGEKDEVRRIVKEKTNVGLLMDNILLQVVKNDVDRAIDQEDEKLLEYIIQVMLSMPPDYNPIEWRAGAARLKYYTQTNNPQKLLGVFQDYGKSLLQHDMRSIVARDSAGLAKYEKDLAEGKVRNPTPESIATSRKFYSSTNQVSYAYMVRDLAKAAYHVIDDEAQLNQGLDWIEHALKYSDNFTILEVKAGLLYKIGKTDQALLTQTQALEQYAGMMSAQNMAMTEKIKARLEGVLQNMKNGKPTWLLENEYFKGGSVPVPK